MKEVMKDRLDDLNVGSGQGTSLNELTTLMTEVTGVHEELGWSPGTDLAEGIERTWHWIRTLMEEDVERGVRSG